MIFVPAGEEHRFTDVTEDLALLVVFGPAYTGAAILSRSEGLPGPRAGGFPAADQADGVSK